MWYMWAHNLVLQPSVMPPKIKSLCLCVQSLIFLVSMVVCRSGVSWGMTGTRKDQTVTRGIFDVHVYGVDSLWYVCTQCMCYFSFKYVYWQVDIHVHISVASVQTLPKRDVLYTILLLFLQRVGICVSSRRNFILAACYQRVEVLFHVFDDDCLCRDVVAKAGIKCICVGLWIHMNYTHSIRSLAAFVNESTHTHLLGQCVRWFIQGRRDWMSWWG